MALRASASAGANGSLGWVIRTRRTVCKAGVIPIESVSWGHRPISTVKDCPRAAALADRLRDGCRELTAQWRDRIAERVSLDPNRVFPTDQLPIMSACDWWHRRLPRGSATR